MSDTDVDRREAAAAASFRVRAKGFVPWSTKLDARTLIKERGGMAEDVVLAEFDAGVLTLTLNRPDSLNALTRPLRQSLLEHLAAAGERQEVGAVLLTGAGRAFCVGQDVAELEAFYAAGGRLDELVAKEYEPLVEAIRSLPKPVVAAVHGAAAGGGMTLALAADLRVASEDAAFHPAFLRVGLGPDSGTTALLVAMVGLSRAAEILLMGTVLRAEALQRLGLVQRVCPSRDECLAEARRLAEELASGPRLAFAAVKEALVESVPTRSLAALERHWQGRLARSDDHREALEAFRNRRPPVFRGK